MYFLHTLSHSVSSKCVAQMLGRDIESKLSPKTAWLRSYLGLTARQVVLALEASPEVLLSTIRHLEGRVRVVVMAVRIAECAKRSSCKMFLGNRAPSGVGGPAEPCTGTSDSPVVVRPPRRRTSLA